MSMLPVSCRWIDKLKLLVSGRRVVSCPWNQETEDPLETDGLINGGAVHGGIPLSNRYVGLIPPLWFGKDWVKVNPML